MLGASVLVRFLVAILAGFGGAAVGLLAGIGIGSILVEIYSISCFEGGCGYYVAFWGLLGGFIGLIAGIAIAVFWRRRSARAAGRQTQGGGETVAASVQPAPEAATSSEPAKASPPAPRTGLDRNSRSAAQFIGAMVAIGVIVVGGFWLYGWISDDTVAGSNQAAPRLYYEVRLPAGTELPEHWRGVDARLDTAKGQAWGQLTTEWAGEDDGRPTISGFFELYYRSSYWILSVALPEGPAYLFRLPLGSAPGHMKDYSDWHSVDFIDDRSADNPRPATEAEDAAIRYRVVYAGQE